MSSVPASASNASNALNFSIAPVVSNDYYHHKFHYRFFVSDDKSSFAPERPTLKHIISFEKSIKVINALDDLVSSVLLNHPCDNPRFETLKRVSKRLHAIRRDDHSEERRGHMRLLLFLEDSFLTLLSTQTFMKQPTEAQMRRLRTHIKSSEPKIIVKYDY